MTRRFFGVVLALLLALLQLLLRRRVGVAIVLLGLLLHHLLHRPQPFDCVSPAKCIVGSGGGS